MATNSNSKIKSLIDKTQFLSSIIPKSLIRKRLYNNISPYSYEDAFNRLYNGIIKNKQEESIINDNYSGERDDIWAEYLNIPLKDRHNIKNKITVSNSKYKPTLGNDNIQYKKLNLTNKDKKRLIVDAIYNNALNFGKNTESYSLGKYFGDHTIGRGIDSKGEYISYYDLWDLSPINTNETDNKERAKGNNGKDQSYGIGTPIHFYDRIYLDDYYGIPKDKRKPNKEDGYYGGYLPEVYVYGKKQHRSLED